MATWQWKSLRICTLFSKKTCDHIFDDKIVQNCPFTKIFGTLFTKCIGHRQVYLVCHLAYFVQLLYLGKQLRPKYHSLDRLATAIRHFTGWLTTCVRTTHWSSSLWKLNPEVNHRGNESGERRAISKNGSSTSVLLAETARKPSLNLCEVLDTPLDSCRPPDH